MSTRKDKIINKSVRKPKEKTDIDTIFTRQVDFNDHKEIFDYRNEYSNNYRMTQMYNFTNIESIFDEIPNEQNKDPMYRLAETPIEKAVGRQLVNIGFDDPLKNCSSFQDNLHCIEELSSTQNNDRLTETPIKKTVACEVLNTGIEDSLQNCSYVDPVNLYCNEELPSSDNTEISDLDLPKDPYADSDDEKDKDYVPEEDSCPCSDNTVEIKDEENLNSIIKPPLISSPIQHCEFEHCSSRVFSCCEKCFCLLCTEHFAPLMQINGCEKHYPYSTENSNLHIESENKENDSNSINLLDNIIDDTVLLCVGNNNTPKKTFESESSQQLGIKDNFTKKNKTQKEDEYKHTISQCEYYHCKEEVFSTCGKCLCFLCFSHFVAEDTYNDCKKHISSLIQKKDIKNGKKKNKASKKDIHGPVLDTESVEEINKEDKTTKEEISRKRKKTEEPLPERQGEGKGLTKKGEPRRRRKLEEPLSERRAKKIVEDNEKLTLKEPCTAACRKKCTEKIRAEHRQEINDEYLSLSWELKGCFIKTLVEPKIVACRKTTNSGRFKRELNYAYHFYQNGVKVEVCKTFFLTTLGYNSKNDKRLMLALKRPIEKQRNQRGKYHRQRKYDKDLIKAHIMDTFNPVNSHYRREHAPNRLYLPSDISITLMHQKFCETYPEQKVSFECYRKIVRDDLNISFAHLGNEECEVCEEFKLKHKNHDQQTEDCEFCKIYSIHTSRYKLARQTYRDDVEKAVEDKDTIYYSADLQKVIMLPRMDQFKRSIFCNRITAFNESYVPLGHSTKNTVPFAAVWHEATSGRKQEDIISTLNAFLLHKRDAKHIVLWMDNCSAQNKNWTLLSFLVYIINSSQILANTITLKYFEPGHTFMSADSFHHQVEKSLQKKNKVYDFGDFIDAVRQANSGRCFVKVMEVNDFYNYVDLSSQHKLRKIEPRVYLKDIMQIQAIRGNFTLQYKTNHNDDEMQSLDFLQVKRAKLRSFPEFDQKTSPRGIPQSTKNGIVEKLLNLMPDNRQAFWLNLPASDAVPNID